ncbi:lipopolysaccharide biosynthesis protein [Thiohalobacter sp.]|uniref:lipopolysaccharide biosynthesis protein n=1 Tax=Thiohalobacter sp. TaxID=2025948 RepID=UPI002601E03A|nr:MATE family efflux transporter [Thiohalobacter sp.]
MNGSKNCGLGRAKLAYRRAPAKKSTTTTMPGRQKTTIVLVDQAVVSGTNFLTGLVLARFLGLEGYGHFVLVYGVVLFVSGIQVALIISPMMVTIPRLKPAEAPAYLRNVTFQQILFSLATFLIAAPTIMALAEILRMPALAELAVPGAATAAAFVTQDFLRRALIVSDHASQGLVNDLVSYLLQLAGLLYWFLGVGQTTYSAFWIITTTSMIAVLHGVRVLAPLMNAGTCRATTAPATFGRVLEQHWEFGRWLVARNIAYWGSSQFLIYLSGALLSAAAVGALTATRNIIGFANILFLALENIVPSRAAAMLEQRGHTGLKKYLRRVSLLGGILTGLVVLVAAAAPEFWLSLVYGEEYAGYGWLVIGWGIYYIVGFFHRPLSAGLRALDKTKDIFTATLFGMIATMLISYPAIRLFELPGAMLSMIVIQLLILLILLKRFQRHVAIHY